MKHSDKNQQTARFQTGDASAKAAVQAEPYWQSFPRMEKLLGAERSPVLAQMEATCRLLDNIVKSGSSQEAARAQTAMTAYARALELYRELATRRDNTWAASNNSTPSSDK